MSFIEKLKSLYLRCENLAFVNHSCIVCGREVPDGTKCSICENCYKKLSKIDGRLCTKCGEILTGDSLVCDYCKNLEYSFESNRSFVYYDEISSAIIKSFKYGGRKYYAKYIAELMCENKNLFDGIDLITFVPISKKRNRSRGFNQAEVLANEISNIVKIPVKEILTKDNSKVNQAGLKRKDRLLNLAGTFHLNGAAKAEVKGKKILIIDDVFTTGTTLSECAKEILKGKPKNIKTYTFAKTKLISLN